MNCRHRPRHCRPSSSRQRNTRSSWPPCSDPLNLTSSPPQLRARSELEKRLTAVQEDLQSSSQQLTAALEIAGTGEELTSTETKIMSCYSAAIAAVGLSQPHPPRLPMSTLIRGGANLALAPVRRLSALVTSAMDTLQSTAAVTAAATRASVDFLRRDRTAPAAALVGLGPLLLDVARDEQSEQCVQQLIALLADLLAILQREEVATIASAVGHTDAAMLQSDALTQLFIARTPIVTHLCSHFALLCCALRSRCRWLARRR